MLIDGAAGPGSFVWILMLSVLCFVFAKASTPGLALDNHYLYSTIEARADPYHLFFQNPAIVVRATWRFCVDCAAW
jgi:hypothetical protein